MTAFPASLIAILCFSGFIIVVKCGAQVVGDVSVTLRPEVPDFIKLSNQATAAQAPPAESPTAKEAPKLTKDKEDEIRFRNVQGREPSRFWVNVAQSTLEMRTQFKPIEKVAKNIIYFIGDGMSVPTITAARIYKGQSEGSAFGEEAQLHLEKFPILGASKTFCSDAQVADSACTATALFTGSKTNYKTIGVTPDVLIGDCDAQMKSENQLSSILAWAQKAGKSTGIVTTTRITHATPAGTYAHIAHRDWENDAEITKAGFDAGKCDDIAEQLILMEPGKNFNVILGGGRKHLLPFDVVDIENQKGMRNDSKHLIDMWKKSKTNKKFAYVETVEDLLKVKPEETDYLLGLFASDHIEYADNITMNHDPSLLNMTNVAIQILSKNPKGFVLMVEGGRIDHALHDSYGQRALREANELDKAVKLADEMTQEDEETLIVVTSDHSHVMSIAGYPVRGNPIFGVGDYSDVDGLPYTTISFANGPGFRNHTEGFRPNISLENTMKIDYKQYSGIPLKYETHGGDDVLIFSKGPYAHLLTGVNLQNYIPHVMAYAACLGQKGAAQSPLCQEEAVRTSAAAPVGHLIPSTSVSWRSVVLLVALCANLIVCSSL